VWAQLWSREIDSVGVLTPSNQAEGHIAGGAIRESLVDPARSEILGTHGISMHGNREVPRSPVGVGEAPPLVGRGVAGRRLAGRGGNALAVSPR
jgi:hypothetical protein